jgi:hypothetical protein
VKIGAGSPYLKRMWPHYWFGYLLLLLSLIHTVVLIQARGLHGLHVLGLWLAAGGLLFLLVQSAGPSLVRRAPMRSWHYWLMFGVVIVVAVHVCLNG